MAVNNPNNDGVKEVCLIDFNLLERQLENQGEFGLVQVSTVLAILRKTRKSNTDFNLTQQPADSQVKS